MPLHRDRRETSQSAKRGPPLRGCLGTPLGLRRGACPDNQSGLRHASCRGACQGNHGVQTWSVLGLAFDRRIVRIIEDTADQECLHLVS